MIQEKLSSEVLQIKPNLIKPYSKGIYNKFDDKQQWIRISEGCPNKCPYCRESWENGTEPIYYNIPEIIRNDVKIMDMNLLYKPKSLEIIKELGSKRVNGKVVYYELVCGIDYRYLTQELSKALKENRFKNIRLAWDWEFGRQKQIKSTIESLVKSGYSSKDLMIFILCNWRISYKDCCSKLDLLKIWRVQVADCYFDNQLSPNIKPIHWTIEEIKDFRHRCRKHNQMVTFGIDPEYKLEVKSGCDANDDGIPPNNKLLGILPTIL